jgi:hypothetical protein
VPRWKKLYTITWVTLAWIAGIDILTFFCTVLASMRFARHLFAPVMLLVSVIATGCANPSAPVAEPLIDSAAYWHHGSFPSCEDTACFPKTFEAARMCEARCLFTKDGRGNAEGFDRAFAGKASPARGPRFFIVAYGPPASGKGAILEYLSRHDAQEGFINERNTISVNVDDIFQGGETGARYQQYRQQVLDKSSDANRTINTQRLYNAYRWIADQISDLTLNRAINDRYHVVWETTGQSNWPKFEISRINRYQYNTIVVYPLVRTSDLVVRAARRARETGPEPAPESVIRAAVGSAQANLVELMPSPECAREAGPKGAGTGAVLYEGECSQRAHRVIILDNTGTKDAVSVFFDSANPTQYCGRRAELLGLLQEQRLAEALRRQPCA